MFDEKHAYEWTRSDRQERKREEAALRQEARVERGDARQLEILEQRGHGHCAEAVRLRAS